MNMRRPTLATLCLALVVLLVLTLSLIGCENVAGPSGPSLAEGPQPNPGPAVGPGPGPQEGMPPDGNPGQMLPPADNPGEGPAVGPGEGALPGPNPSFGGTPTTKKTTSTTKAGGTLMEVQPLPATGGALAEVLPLTATRYEESDSHLTWTGKHVLGFGSGSASSDQWVMTSLGATVTVRFSGTSLTWVGYKGTDGSRATLTLDGGSSWTVDTYSSTDQYTATLWQSGFLSNGSHTVLIEASGLPASGQVCVAVDAFYIIGTIQ